MARRGADVNAFQPRVVSWPGPLRGLPSPFRAASTTNALSLAITGKHWDLAGWLLDHGDVPGVDGPELLSGAAGDGPVRVVRGLLEGGVPVESTRHWDGWTPLVEAVVAHRADTVALLLERGASLQALLKTYPRSVIFNGQPTRPVDNFQGGYRPSDGAILRALVRHGLPVNFRLRAEETPLIAATLAGDRETVEFLLANGADVHARDGLGFSALYYATIQSRKEIADRLRQAGAVKDW